MHGGRFCRKLSEILNPTWEHETGPLLDKLRRWQYEVNIYQGETGEQLSDRLKCAVVLRFAPLEVKDVLRRSPANIMDSFETLMEALESYRQRGMAFTTGGTVKTTAVPMEVDVTESGSKNNHNLKKLVGEK